MSTRAERDARIDELVAATNRWEKTVITELEARVASSKRILKGRTGSERLTGAVAKKGETLVVASISAFLVG